MLQAIYFDYAANGINYATIWDGPGLPFAGSLIMISVDILLYLFLAYYLDNVIPSMVNTLKIKHPHYHFCGIVSN